MGPPATPKTVVPQIDSSLYTAQFAAVLAEYSATAPIWVPAKRGLTERGRQRTSSNDWRHVTALGWLLLISIGAASWYAIVDPVWRTREIIPGPVTTSPPILPTSMPSLWLLESETLLVNGVRVAAAAHDWVLAMTDHPIFPEAAEMSVDPAEVSVDPAEMSVDTAALSTPATLPPPQTTQPAATAPPSTDQSPRDTIGVRPGDELEKPITVRNGELKGELGNPLFDLYPEQPQSALPNVSTASRAGTETTPSENPQAGSSGADVLDAKGDAGDAGSHAGSQDPHPGDGISQGKEKSETKAGPGGSAPAGDSGQHNKGPKAGNDTPSAGKSAPGRSQDNHTSNGSGPSKGKADPNKNSKSDADKKDQKDKGSGGKDNGKQGKAKDSH